MKDGRTRLAHKLEVGVDMETGAVAGVTVQTMDGGDTASLPVTLDETERQLAKVGAEPKEVVGDKGYHSNATMTGVKDRGLRSYVSEPNRGRRKWKGKRDAQKAVYGNRRRIRGNRGKRLLRRRGEKLERTFAHLLVSGGLRRVHVRGQKEIRKRLLLHAAAFNLGLMMRARFGFGTPRGLQGLAAAAAALADASARHFATVVGQIGRIFGLLSPNTGSFRPSGRLLHNKDRAHSPPAVRTIGALADHFFHDSGLSRSEARPSWAGSCPVFNRQRSGPVRMPPTGTFSPSGKPRVTSASPLLTLLRHLTGASSSEVTSTSILRGALKRGAASHVEGSREAGVRYLGSPAARARGRGRS